jgi:uncharacterized protein YciI
MPLSGTGSPELLLVTRWIATLEPGPNFVPSKTYLEQPFINEHLQFYRRMLDRDEMIVGGPFTTLGMEHLVFTDRITNYSEAKALIEQDPAVRAGVLSVRIGEWFTNAFAGQRVTFFPEDSVALRQTAQMFVETGYGALAEEVGGKILGEIGSKIGQAIGRVAGEIVTDLQGARRKPGPPAEPEPSPSPRSEDQLPDGAPLPYFKTRWVAMILAGRKFNPLVLAPKQAVVPDHVRMMEHNFLDGKLAMAGPEPNFYTAWFIFSDQVTTYEAAKAIVDADPAVQDGILEGRVLEWCTNIRKGETSGFFGADLDVVRATGQALTNAGFFPVRG